MTAPVPRFGHHRKELDHAHQHCSTSPPAGFAPAHDLMVALDIGKDVHILYARTAAGTAVLAPTKLPTLAAGFQTLTTHLDAWLARGAFDQIVLGHEPTGVYHDAWAAALIARYQPHLTGAATPFWG